MTQPLKPDGDPEVQKPQSHLETHAIETHTGDFLGQLRSLVSNTSAPTDIAPALAPLNNLRVSSHTTLDEFKAAVQSAKDAFAKLQNPTASMLEEFYRQIRMRTHAFLGCHMVALDSLTRSDGLATIAPFCREGGLEMFLTHLESVISYWAKVVDVPENFGRVSQSEDITSLRKAVEDALPALWKVEAHRLDYAATKIFDSDMDQWRVLTARADAARAKAKSFGGASNAKRKFDDEEPDPWGA